MNWREIDRILSELNLPGTFIRDISQPEPSTLYLLLNRPHNRGSSLDSRRITLLCSWSTGTSRLHRTTDLFPKSRPPIPRFVTFLRAHVRGSRIISAFQFGTERIVRVTCGTRDRQRIMWIRLWSRSSNCIVTDKHGMILEALMRRPQRGEVAGSHYDPSVKINTRFDAERYELRSLSGNNDYNTQLDEYYRTQKQTESAEHALTVARQRFEHEQTLLTTRISRLKKALNDAADFESLRIAGQTILSNAHILSKSDAQLLPTGNNESIVLIPGLTPSENADHYFDRYRRHRAASLHIQQNLNNAVQRLHDLRAGGVEPFHVTDPSELTQPVRTSPSNPWRSYKSGGWVLHVGKSATANDTLLRYIAGGNDYWLHCRDHAGAHVFLMAQRGKSPPLETLLDAANLALFFSKARRIGQADIHYTQVKNLRRAKDRAPGSVVPMREKNLFVRLDQKRLDLLLGIDETRDY